MARTWVVLQILQWRTHLDSPCAVRTLPPDPCGHAIVLGAELKPRNGLHRCLLAGPQLWTNTEASLPRAQPGVLQLSYLEAVGPTCRTAVYAAESDRSPSWVRAALGIPGLASPSGIREPCSSIEPALPDRPWTRLAIREYFLARPPSVSGNGSFTRCAEYPALW